MSRIALGLALAGLGLTACSIPDTAFHATPDGGGPDKPTDVLAIVVSKPAVALDEGATDDFTVKLSQAPASPIEIDLSTASQKIGLSAQKLFFDATSFAREQTVTVTGLPDDDTATELADITLTGSGVADVTVGATVRDPDKVAIVASISDGATVTEGKSTDVHVHLSHRPPGDVTVTAMMSSGPITVAPALHVFHMDDTYATDVTFTLSAPLDANVDNEMQTVTFAISGGDQKTVQVVDVDVDKLAISASPTSISHLLEGDSATINLTLTRQPPAGGVTVTATSMNGKVVFVGNSSVMFTPGDYTMNHPITIQAPQDTNTTPENDTITLTMAGHSEVQPINVSVQIDDDDVQAIQTTVINSLTVTEAASTTFGVTLKFAPTGTFTVNLATGDGGVATADASGANFLTFTASDYSNAGMHPVTVHGTHDNNLVTNSTTVKLTSANPPLETDVNVDVNDIDHEAFVLTPSTPLSIPEGTNGTFTVALAFQPTAPVRALIASNNPGALPVSPPFIDFTTSNWQTPITVTVSPPVDKNAMTETATISVSSSPTSPSVPTASVTATTVDSTVIETEGWPSPFSGTISERASAVIAYKIHIGTTTLDSFGIYVPVASGSFRMALYSDNGNKPGTLVGSVTSQFPATTLVNGMNIVDVPDVPLTVGDYWLALRVSSTTNVGGTSGTLGRRCVADFDIVGLTNNWSSDFGVSDPTTGCGDVGLINIWTTTYHQ